MAGWHHWPDGHEFEWTPGDGDGQGGLACCNSWGHKELDTNERLNWIEVGKEEVQLSLLSGDMMLYRENPEDSTKKLLELMSEFIYVSGYKVNIEKSVVIL